ncbi:NrsF family protein [Bradyrhizobium sp. USDA 4369]
MDTLDLIASLASDMKPVKRLQPPLLRALGWLSSAAVLLVLLAVNRGIRPDLAERLQDPAFATSMAAALATGVLAAVAAFHISLPDRSRLWLLLPVPTVCIWLSNIGYQCLTHWVVIGPEGVSPGEAVRCFSTLALTGLPLSLLLGVMLRYAAVLRPTAVAVTGSLAVGALTAAALSLFHTIDASAMILMWNVGTALVFATLGAVFGQSAMRWLAQRLS